MEVTLIRHGQSESNARLTAELDAKLTDLGISQAQATAEYLLSSGIVADVSRTELFVSPFLRTLQTAAPFAKASGLTAHAYPDMCEYFSHNNDAYRTFSGLTPEMIQEKFPYVILNDAIACEARWWPAEQEDVHGIYARAERVRDQIIQRYFKTAKQVIIYSHAEPIGRLIEAFLHEQPSLGWPPWNENCGISRLLVGNPEQPADLVVMNDTSHLRERGIVSPTFPGFNAPPPAA